MKLSIPNCLLVVRQWFFKKRKIFLVLFCVGILEVKSQIVNYIANGSFEEAYDCWPPYALIKAKSWLSIDSASYGGLLAQTCYSAVPLNAHAYQIPVSGKAYLISAFYYKNNVRGYLKNRLKQTLQNGTTYCVKFYVNISNKSPRGIDGFGIYFGDNTIDTITRCNSPITYLNPQVKNPIGNVITDTMNWVPITGTFVANGTEKYALIGNFLSDNALTTASLNSPYYPQNWTDVLIDDVSCLEFNLPAYAGPDQTFFPTDSVFIGRQPDFAIDPGCVWYELPNPTPIATISGLWVKPAVTTTYVVRQELDCSPLKFDTVVVFRSPVGIQSFGLFISGLEVYPVPADEVLNVKLESQPAQQNYTLMIYDHLGQLVKEDEIQFINSRGSVKTDRLNSGAYLLLLKDKHSYSVSKRFVIAR